MCFRCFSHARVVLAFRLLRLSSQQLRYASLSLIYMPQVDNSLHPYAFDGSVSLYLPGTQHMHIVYCCWFAFAVGRFHSTRGNAAHLDSNKRKRNKCRIAYHAVLPTTSGNSCIASAVSVAMPRRVCRDASERERFGVQ